LVNKGKCADCLKNIGVCSMREMNDPVEDGGDKYMGLSKLFIKDVLTGSTSYDDAKEAIDKALAREQDRRDEEEYGDDYDTYADMPEAAPDVKVSMVYMKPDMVGMIKVLREMDGIPSKWAGEHNELLQAAAMLESMIAIHNDPKNDPNVTGNQGKYNEEREHINKFYPELHDRLTKYLERYNTDIGEDDGGNSR
jgi:hypothetical protein